MTGNSGNTRGALFGWHPARLVALGFGIGLTPRAPGTAGTLLAVPLYLALRPLPLAGYVMVIVAASVLGIWLCASAARQLGVHDHPAIVWDEMVGYWITMIAAPGHWGWIVVGFVAFRLFDIAKPWPIGLVDRRMRGGAGIMADDVLAGLYGLVVVQLLVYGFG